MIRRLATPSLGRAVPPGGVWGGVGGCNTPKLAGRGPWHAGIAFFFKNEDFFAENFGNFCFQKNNVDAAPFQDPPPLGGALKWKGAQILEYTPQPETGWHGPVPRFRGAHTFARLPPVNPSLSSWAYGKEKIRGAEENLPGFFGLFPTSPEKIVCGTN